MGLLPIPRVWVQRWPDSDLTPTIYLHALLVYIRALSAVEEKRPHSGAYNIISGKVEIISNVASSYAGPTYNMTL